MLTICYKTVQPVVYNPGTPHESKCDTFLAKEVGYDMEWAKQVLAKLESEKPAHIDHYFIKEQESVLYH